jgi:hypothetical protein
MCVDGIWVDLLTEMLYFIILLAISLTFYYEF